MSVATAESAEHGLADGPVLGMSVGTVSADESDFAGIGGGRDAVIGFSVIDARRGPGMVRSDAGPFVLVATVGGE